ncbi:MAG: hypothetical protein HQK76_03730 [Desulfobacterales bacterium]|nr:hypothetical protein [Desulfobacterales bacterium]
MEELKRREFLKQACKLTGCLIIMPLATSCKVNNNPLSIPLSKPSDWNPIDFNRKRGNAGAIPTSYLKDINGPDGEKKHIGKHLPYIPEIDIDIPKGFIPIMWGDPSKGYIPHPNAPADKTKNYEGHWYNWIWIRKARERWAESCQSTYSGWPQIMTGDTAGYMVSGGGDITDKKGVNTIYIAALPEGIKKGDTLRIWAHCLTHGEYVDFIRV